MRSFAERQLHLPIVLPHERMLPAFLMEIALGILTVVARAPNMMTSL